VANNQIKVRKHLTVLMGTERATYNKISYSEPSM